MSKEYKEARDAVFQEIFDLAVQDREVFLITADTGAFLIHEFKKQLPSQFLNVGIAEQNAISAAAGLALAGKKVFVFGIANFVTLRCYEQIKVDVCCMELPVTIIGMGTGYVYPKDGPTHHMTNILSVMRTLPCIHVWSPSDYAMIAACTRQAYRSGAPNYIYMDKGPFIPHYQPEMDLAVGAAQLYSGKDLQIFTTGIMVPQAIRVRELLSNRGIAAGIVDVYRIKPTNSSWLAQALSACSKAVTLEENVIEGGLGGLICEVAAEQASGTQVKRFGLADRYRCEIGSRDDLRTLDGLEAAQLTQAIEKWMS